MVQKNSIKPKIIIVAGPTASGKSALALDIAMDFNGEIISADSMQVYKGLNIGTGKITDEEKKGIKHHLIDIKDPCEEYSVSEFVSAAKKAVQDISARGKVPIITGGTGLYINGLLNNYNFSKTPKESEIRQRLKEELDRSGADSLYESLLKIDPVSAAKISKNDVKRVMRALEIYYASEKTKSEAEASGKPEYDYLFFVLEREREKLYKRIEERVDKMLESGLIREVEGLKRFSGSQALQAIGYKEVISYLSGEAALDECVGNIKRNSRRYAKRQITFFKGMKADKIWISPHDKEQISDRIRLFLDTMSDIT